MNQELNPQNVNKTPSLANDDSSMPNTEDRQMNIPDSPANYAKNSDTGPVTPEGYDPSRSQNHYKRSGQVAQPGGGVTRRTDLSNAAANAAGKAPIVNSGNTQPDLSEPQSEKTADDTEDAPENIPPEEKPEKKQIAEELKEKKQQIARTLKIVKLLWPIILVLFLFIIMTILVIGPHFAIVDLTANETFEGPGPGDEGSGQLVETAGRLFRRLYAENFTYALVGLSVPITGRQVSCANFVAWALYESGDTRFAGSNWNSVGNFVNAQSTFQSWGWTVTELTAHQDAIPLLQPGDILLRRTPLRGTAACPGCGHIIIVSSVDGGVVYGYSAGATSSWQRNQGGPINRTEMAAGTGSGHGSRPGMIIRPR